MCAKKWLPILTFPCALHTVLGWALLAGHCPHDEAPAATNEGLLSWLATLEDA